MNSPDVKVALSRPIQAHGEELRELTMREPTGKDLRIVGLPYTMKGEDISIDADRIARMAVQLCAIPLSSVDQLSAVDFQAVVTAIMGFFQPVQAAG